MSKLSKDQKRKRKAIKAKKAQATACCEAGRILNINKNSVDDLSQKFHIQEFNGMDDILDFDDLEPSEYRVIFDDYLRAIDKQLFLNVTAEKHNLSFNPDLFFEMIIDDFTENNQISQELKDIAYSSSLKLYEIANEIEKAGFKEYSALIRPVIEECGYDTGAR